MATVKTAILLDKELLQRADDFASSLKVSRSRVVALALEGYLRQQENLALLEKINASYDGTPDPEEEARLRSARRSFRKIVEEW